ncbi:hypothetical protein GCM10022252_76340 [Streptosporangium oxazolinicum]|uniref:Uncharacterized protein n=1 Tax=Streptosporangium oxazolinicum TaxID=909287 RepID=A0ABP8BLP0_9ACTN
MRFTPLAVLAAIAAIVVALWAPAPALAAPGTGDITAPTSGQTVKVGDSVKVAATASEVCQAAITLTTPGGQASTLVTREAPLCTGALSLGASFTPEAAGTYRLALAGDVQLSVVEITAAAPATPTPRETVTVTPSPTASASTSATPTATPKPTVTVTVTPKVKTPTPTPKPAVTRTVRATVTAPAPQVGAAPAPAPAPVVVLTGAPAPMPVMDTATGQEPAQEVVFPAASSAPPAGEPVALQLVAVAGQMADAVWRLIVGFVLCGALVGGGLWLMFTLRKRGSRHNGTGRKRG